MSYGVNQDSKPRICLLELVRHISEKTDQVAVLFTVLFVSSLAAERLLHTKFSDPIHDVLMAVDISVFLLLALYLILRAIYLKHPNRQWALALSDQDCKNLRTQMKSGDGVAMNKIGVCRREFVNHTRAQILLELNYEAFKDTVFGMEREQLRKRNSGWIAKNQHIFMLIRDPLAKNEYIGYSCLLPLTENGALLYRDGKLRDADIPAELVTQRNQRPHSVLLFAIMLKSEYSFEKEGAARQYSMYFLNSILRHITDFYSPWRTGGTTPPLLAQTESKSLARRLYSAGFRKIANTRTADGCDLWELIQPLSSVEVILRSAAA